MALFVTYVLKPKNKVISNLILLLYGKCEQEKILEYQKSTKQV